MCASRKFKIYRSHFYGFEVFEFEILEQIEPCRWKLMDTGKLFGIFLFCKYIWNMERLYKHASWFKTTKPQTCNLNLPQEKDLSSQSYKTGLAFFFYFYYEFMIPLVFDTTCICHRPACIHSTY